MIFKQISIVTLAGFILVTACAKTPVPPIPARQQNISGYSEVKFGTSREQAVAILNSSGHKLNHAQNSVSYKNSWGGADFYVTQFFENNLASTSVLNLTNAGLIKSEQECGQWYNYLAGRLQYQYGRADIATSPEKLAAGRDIILRITFQDSSRIDLYYDFNPAQTSNACTIRIYFQPIWAKKLCLITNNRFCETDSNFIYLGD